MSYNCLKIGSVGIVGVKWEQIFFPHDLPNEWKLDYYANEYESILLTALDIEKFDTITEDFDGSELTIYTYKYDKELGEQFKKISKLVKLQLINKPFEKTVLNNLTQVLTEQETIVYIYDEDKVIRPQDLKTIFDYCIDNSKDASLFFADNKYTIENINNMQILKKLMTV